MQNKQNKCKTNTCHWWDYDGILVALLWIRCFPGTEDWGTAWQCQSTTKSYTLCFQKNSEWKFTWLWVFQQFCVVLVQKITSQAKMKSFPERFLNNLENKKKLEPFSMQILLSYIDSFSDSILLILVKFPFIW